MTAVTEGGDGKLRLPYWFSAAHLCIDWPFGAVYVIAPVMAAAFGWSPAQVGLLLTLQSVVAAVAYIPAGLLMDRVSNRGRVLAMTFFWVVAGYLLASTAGSFWPLALLMAMAAIGDAAWHPMATGILVKSAPDKRAKVLGIHAIGGSLAVVLAPLSTGYLLEFVDWRTAFQLILVPTLVMGALILFYVGPRMPRVALDRAVSVDLKLLWRQWSTPFALMLVLMMVLYNLGQVGAMAMMPLYLKGTLGFDISQTGLAFAAVLLVGALIQPWVGQASDRIGRRPVIAMSCALAAAGGVAVFLADGPVLALLGLTVCTGALTGVRSTVLACAVDLSGQSESTTMGVAFAVMDGIGAMGALIAGLVGEVELSRAFLMAAVCAGGAGTIALILKGWGGR
ncbi:MAG: MFS transporter [Alphaproteobacteria bacterium]